MVISSCVNQKDQVADLLRQKFGGSRPTLIFAIFSLLQSYVYGWKKYPCKRELKRKRCAYEVHLTSLTDAYPISALGESHIDFVLAAFTFTFYIIKKT